MNQIPLRKKLELSFLLFLGLCVTACSAKTEIQKKYGPDADYFIAQKLLLEKDESQARIKFNQCVKNGSYFCARKSAEALCTFGSVQDRNQAVLRLLEKYNDAQSLGVAVRQLFSAGEVHKVIEITRDIPFATAENAVIKCRLEALKRRGDASYEQEVFRWFMVRELSSEHYQFWRDVYEHPDFEAEDASFTPEQFLMNYRIEIYRRNYTYTYSVADKVLGYFSDGTVAPQAQVASDIGKAFLYGNPSFVNNAMKFRSFAQEFAGTPVEFYFWFYSGRLFSKAGPYFAQTKKSFEQAVRAAQTPQQKDNAIWYLLNESLYYSFDSIVPAIKEYAPQWDNPEYFEDFFDTLVTSLLAAGKWNEFREIYTVTDGLATDEITAQFAFIYARLVEEGLASGDAQNVQAAYRRALSSASSFYYKILAAHRLSLSDDELEAVLCASYSSGAEPSDECGRLLEGYADFGLPDFIYETWKDLDRIRIPTRSALYVADFLNKCSTGKDSYYEQALRIAARALSTSGIPFSREQMQFVFPQNYLPLVETYCQKYGIETSVMFALIRSESFFSPVISSSADAVGLTQLMELTAGDIARKLKVKEYSLLDPETNIEFGTYYLSELYHRCDDSLVQAFFSYNAGITRVRRWLQSSLSEFGKKKDMPLDLFLETVPYTETRNYGRKLVSASAMYEWLYSENPSQAFHAMIDTLLYKSLEE